MAVRSQSGVSDILEELADKAITHINRLAVTSFDAALDEMVDFHRFLIEAYTVKDETGRVFSYAEGGDFSPLHIEWLRQYRRIFERAVENIGRENYFVERLLRIPISLLPKDARQAAPKVTVALLDFPNYAVHGLERWFIRSRTHEVFEIEEEKLVAQLVGPDKKAYEEVLTNFIGTWESTLRIVGHIYEWRKGGIAPEDQWQRYVASWPFLQRHLGNSAYLLATAVWNDDEMAASLYTETLLRWSNNLRHDIDEYDYPEELLPTAELIEEEWSSVEKRLDKLVTYWHDGVFQPSTIFRSILRNTHADVIFLIAGLLLAWFVEKQRTSDLAPRIVSNLLINGAASDDDAGSILTIGPIGSSPLILRIFWIYLVGERFERHGYGGWLDSLISSLDSMTERRVVPGRSYTPSTRDEREDLRLPWVVLLLAYLPTDGDGESLDQAINLLLEQAAERGALSLLGHELEQTKNIFRSDNLERLFRGVLALQPDANVEERIRALDATLNKMAEKIRLQPGQ